MCAHKICLQIYSILSTRLHRELSASESPSTSQIKLQLTIWILSWCWAPRCGPDAWWRSAGRDIGYKRLIKWKNIDILDICLSNDWFSKLRKATKSTTHLSRQPSGVQDAHNILRFVLSYHVTHTCGRENTLEDKVKKIENYKQNEQSLMVWIWQLPRVVEVVDHRSLLGHRYLLPKTPLCCFHLR